jgi:hypothetical protein
VYFPTKGWVTFDPTPPNRTDPLGRGGSGWRARMSRFMDTMRFQWTKWVIEYDLVAQLGLFKDIGSAIKRGMTAVRDAIAVVLHYWPALGGVIVLIVALSLRRRRREAPGFEPGRKRPPRTRSAIAHTYQATLKTLAKHGITREPGVTPQELAARLTTPIGPPVRELTELYYAAEWGGRSDPAAERRASELATTIRTTLAHRA